jgi:hypothetical protein
MISVVSPRQAARVIVIAKELCLEDLIGKYRFWLWQTQLILS